MSCAQGSPDSEPGCHHARGLASQALASPTSPPAARPACAPALQVFRCVCAWMCEHTPGKRVSLVRPAAATPSDCPPSSWSSLSVSDSWQKICPQLSDPTNFGLVFRSPQTLRVFGEFMSNISVSTTRGNQDMRFSVCGSPRGDLSHIAGLTLGRSRSDFSGVNRRPQEPYMWGVGLTQQIA